MGGWLVLVLNAAWSADVELIFFFALLFFFRVGDLLCYVYAS